jgi:hypothetical protein
MRDEINTDAISGEVEQQPAANRPIDLPAKAWILDQKKSSLQEAALVSK